MSSHGVDDHHASDPDRGLVLEDGTPVVAAYLDGASLRDLASRSRLSRPTITKHLRRRGVLRANPSRPLPDDPAYWSTRVEGDHTVTDLAKQHHTSTTSIYRHLAKLGLRRPSRVPFDQWLQTRTETSGDCLLWTGPHTSSGYPLAHHQGTVTTATRAVWEHHHGPIPPRHDITHTDTCSQRSCVQVSHLKLLSSDDRGSTRRARGSSPRGEQHWNAKLSESDVRLILASQQNPDQLGVRFGVTAHTINEIRAGRRWSWMQT